MPAPPLQYSVKMKKNKTMIIVATLLLQLLAATSAESVAGSWLSRGLGATEDMEVASRETPEETAIPNLFGPDETQYERFAACVAASGMTVSEFSQLGKVISQDTRLRDKVWGL